MHKKIFFFLFVIGFISTYGQNGPIKISDETKNNRLSVFANNESETDYDVKITITGSNIRQSSAKPRLIRVPAASKVLLKSLIINRGKQPSYTYDLVINDSLSRRAIKPPFKSIRINPKKSIILYITENCKTCDTLLSELNNSNYKFTSINLFEKPEVKDRMATYLKNEVPSLDSFSNPIISLGGFLHTKINNYSTLLEALNKQE